MALPVGVRRIQSVIGGEGEVVTNILLEGAPEGEPEWLKVKEELDEVREEERE